MRTLPPLSPFFFFLPPLFSHSLFLSLLSLSLPLSPLTLSFSLDSHVNGRKPTPLTLPFPPPAAGLSIALFAPGWTYETISWADYPARQLALWAQLEARIPPIRVCGLPLRTSFSLGYGPRLAIDGHTARAMPWANLSAQDVLPSFPAASELTPYFLQRGAARSFPNLSVSLESECAFNGGSCLRVACDTALSSTAAAVTPPLVENATVEAESQPQPQPYASAPRAYIRLLATAIDLKAPCCISVTVGHRSDRAALLRPTLLLVLNSEPSAIRYIEVPAWTDGAALGEEWKPVASEPKLAARLSERHGLHASPLLRSDTALDRYVLQPACVPTEAPHSVTESRSDRAQPEQQQMALDAAGGETAASRLTEFAPLPPSDGAVQWTRHWFVLARSEFKQRQIHELRLAVLPPTEAGMAGEVLLGDIKFFSPAALAVAANTA